MIYFIRSLIFSAGYALLTMVYGTLSLFLFFIPRKIRYSIIVSWTHIVIFWLRITCGIRYQIIGQENLPSPITSHIVLSKHQSTWETLFLQGFFAPGATVLKRQLLKIPFFGWGLRGLAPIAIDRDNPREALKQVKTQSIKRLNQAYNIILFPEGTRTKVGQKGKYARSGADIAIAAKKNIIPIAINAGHLWTPGQFIKTPGLITVSIGPIISGEGKNSKTLIQDVETWIETEMQRINQL